MYRPRREWAWDEKAEEQYRIKRESLAAKGYVSDEDVARFFQEQGVPGLRPQDIRARAETSGHPRHHARFHLRNPFCASHARAVLTQEIHMNAPLKEPVVTVLLETAFFDVIDVNDGTRPVGKGYKIVREPKAVNGVVVVPMLPDGRLVLASLMRRAIGHVSIEFPRGKIDNDETPREAGAREVSEEIGMRVTGIKELGKLHSNTSLLASSVAVCVATVSGDVESDTDGEVDHTMIKTVEEAKAMIASGEITDGHTISALMMLLCQIDY